MNRLAHSILKEIGFTLLAEGKTLKVKAEGYSMYPTIKPGSVIYIEPVEMGNEPVAGEIIAWKKDSGFVVHRLTKVLKEEEIISFVTRGDSCMDEDDPVTFDQLAGRVVKVETPGGKLHRTSIQKIKIPPYKINSLRVWAIFRFRRIQKILNLR